MSKTPEGEERLPRRFSASASPSSEIDVVNLSSQLVSMELLTTSNQSLTTTNTAAKTRKRKLAQRVRFDVPEDIDEKKPVSLQKRRRRSPSPGIEEKRKTSPTRSPTYFKVAWKTRRTAVSHKAMVPRSTMSTKQTTSSVPDNKNKTCPQNLQYLPCNTNDACPVSPEDEEKKTDSDGLEPLRIIHDQNNNCASSSYKTSRKGQYAAVKKSKSYAAACSKKKQKPVGISKKSGVKTTKLSKGVKRIYNVDCFGDVLYKNKKVKRQRVSHPKRKAAKSKTACKSKKKSTRSKSRSPVARKSSAKKRVKSVSYRCKKASRKGKEKKEKMTKAKKAKRARLQQRLKKAASKKLKLKQKCSKKVKKNKRSLASKLKKNPQARRHSRGPTCRCKRKRKLHIRPIERDSESYDVIPPLRVSFLKYITFKEAFGQKYECCRKYCWDDWREEEIGDIINDYED